MKSVFILICIAKIYFNQPDPKREGEKLIVSLTKDNFDASVRINKHQKFVVLFYTKKNKLSKKVLPLYNKIAFDEQNKDIQFAQVDCKAEKDLCTLLRIRSYPAMYIIIADKMYQYQKKPQEIQMKNFIKKDWMEKSGRKIPTKMPSFFEDIIHVFQVFIEEGKNTFQSEGKYFWKGMYSILIFLSFVIFILLVYLFYLIFDFFRPVDYSQVPNKDKKKDDKKLKKD